MRQHVARGGLCYEPFSGSGSQIMAGEANGRRVFAMEISPAYVDVAVERWQAETGRDAILDGDGRTFAQVRTERLGDDAEAPADDAGHGRRPRTRAKAQIRRVSMHDLALLPSGRASGAGDACLFGLSLCSGAGGLDLGLAIAIPGYRAVGHVERETFAAATLVARMEDASLGSGRLVWDDVGTFDGRPWRGAVDIVTAGYPCQPFRSPSRAPARTTRATSGRMSPASSARSSRPSSSSRMSPIISASASPKSPADWSAWATACGRPLHGGGSRRAPQARAALHPRHPRGRTQPRGRGPGRARLLEPAQLAASSDGHAPGTVRASTAGAVRARAARQNGCRRGLWMRSTPQPTPQTDSFTQPGLRADHRDGEGLDPMALATGRRRWPNDGWQRGERAREPAAADLTHAAGMWMTPTARDHKDGATALRTRR